MATRERAGTGIKGGQMRDERKNERGKKRDGLTGVKGKYLLLHV